MSAYQAAYDEYSRQSEKAQELFDASTKEAIFTASRILSMQAVYLLNKLGEHELPDIRKIVLDTNIDQAAMELLRDGTAALVATLQKSIEAKQ